MFILKIAHCIYQSIRIQREHKQQIHELLFKCQEKYLEVKTKIKDLIPSLEQLLGGLRA